MNTIMQRKKAVNHPFNSYNEETTWERIVRRLLHIRGHCWYKRIAKAKVTQTL